MSTDRRFSVTLSEDDLRPHMRKPKPKPMTPTVEIPKPMESEIEALRLKYEKREEVKKEVKRRIEEEEKEKAQRDRDEQIRLETEKLMKSTRPPSNNRNESEIYPKLGRRFNNSQYFNWNDDEDMIPVIQPELSRPLSRRAPSPFLQSSPSDVCELCTLAMRGKPSKSAACAHLDAFLASQRH